MTKESSFEDQLNELEAIVDAISQTNNLEESLQKFERGLVLAESATKRLNKIENRLIEIKQKFATKDVAIEEPLITEEEKI